MGFAEMMRLNRDDGSLWLVYLRITDTQFLELFPDGEGERAPGAGRDRHQSFLPGMRRSRSHGGGAARRPASG